MQCQGAIGNIRVQIPEAIGSCQFNAAKPNCEVFLSSDFKSLSLCLSFCIFLPHFHSFSFIVFSLQVAFMKAQTFSEARKQDTGCCEGPASRVADGADVRFVPCYVCDVFPHGSVFLYFCLCALQHCISFRPQVPSSMKPGEQAWQEHEKGWWPGNWKWNEAE